MLTEAQRIIVQEVCSIQYKSLTDILTRVELGADDDGEEYLDIMEEMGFDREDFDEELIATIRGFEMVKLNPERVFQLVELDMLVFRHILHNFSHHWVGKFPKAMANLWNKLFIQQMSNLNRN